MSVPHDWIPAGSSGVLADPPPGPPREHVLAGLQGTDEGGADLVQLLTPEGERIACPAFDAHVADVDTAALQALYRDMVLVRRADREATALQRQGELGLWVPLLGQEAAQIGARPRAARRATWRSRATASTASRGAVASIPPSCWASSVAPTTAAGTRSRPASTSTRSSSATSASTPPATRWASASTAGSAGRTREATMCFFGDGATSQGDVHEGFVWAAVYDAPVVFYCQNNQWAISDPNERQTRVPLYRRAQGYGFPGIRVDGNDVLACLAVSRWALEECRSGNGPVLIEAFTYRMDAHTTSDDPSRYRLADELELWKLKDPMERVRVHLVRGLGVGNDFFDEVAADSDALAARLRAHCLVACLNRGRSGSSRTSTPSPRRSSTPSATRTWPITRPSKVARRP